MSEESTSCLSIFSTSKKVGNFRPFQKAEVAGMQFNRFVQILFGLFEISFPDQARDALVSPTASFGPRRRFWSIRAMVSSNSSSPIGTSFLWEEIFALDTSGRTYDDWSGIFSLLLSFSLRCIHDDPQACGSLFVFEVQLQRLRGNFACFLKPPDAKQAIRQHEPGSRMLR